ncbi:MAG: hypothetical protein CME17_04075 [Gemmatimonadetes bacterium]|nr:hypothetical protein [Gemmatimonadota bacterium]
MTEKKAVDAVVSALKDKKKGLSMKSVKQVIAKALGIQRVHPSRLKPVLALGKKLQLFIEKESRVVAYSHRVRLEIPGFDSMSPAAQGYYLRAIRYGPMYKDQAERYARYCLDCKELGTVEVHPKLWMAGYTEVSQVPIDELVPVEPSRAVLDMPLAEVYGEEEQ